MIARLRAIPLRSVTKRPKLLVYIFLAVTICAFVGCGGGDKKGGSKDRQFSESGRANKDGLSYKKVSRPTNQSAPKSPEIQNPANFDNIVENAYQLAALRPKSTFSVDVDTASYTLVRGEIMDRNTLPTKNSVRLEEMINYFHYNYPNPSGEHPISVNTEVAKAFWDPRLHLVRIGLKAKEVPDAEIPNMNLVFLLDKSGSMNTPTRLPLFKQALRLLLQRLRKEDQVAIVTYNDNAQVALPSTPVRDMDTILTALSKIHPGGSTNGGAGLEEAYAIASKNFIQGGVNRVILGTDGDFNVGTTGRDPLVRLIEDKRKSGITLSVLGFGVNNLQDGQLQAIAQKGNGQYSHIGKMSDATRFFLEKLGTFHLIAKNVKIQIEFNPTEVYAYRLLGYENRKMANKDFDDDTKDAGDMGAGQTVTAYYVVAPHGTELNHPVEPNASPETKSAPNGPEGTLMTVRVRYLKPDNVESRLISQAVGKNDQSFNNASRDFRFSAAVASFGMLLRNSKYRGSTSYQKVIDIVSRSGGAEQGTERGEFRNLVIRTQQLRGNE
ncbi:MAG: von Willebrand factor type A domain-containing protein [Gemmataceae bacterium]